MQKANHRLSTFARKFSAKTWKDNGTHFDGVNARSVCKIWNGRETSYDPFRKNKGNEKFSWPVVSTHVVCTLLLCSNSTTKISSSSSHCGSTQSMRRIQMRSINHFKEKSEKNEEKSRNISFDNWLPEIAWNCATHERRINKTGKGAANVRMQTFAPGPSGIFVPSHLGQSQSSRRKCLSLCAFHCYFHFFLNNKNTK